MPTSRDFENTAAVVARIQTRLCDDHGRETLIFRGTAKTYPDRDGINSSIYRKPENRLLFTEFDGFRPIHVEHEIVANVKRRFRPGAGNIEILTDLRHFAGDTTLIDFSRNILVALFFACKSDVDSCGELIVLREQEFGRLSDEEYNENLRGLHIVEPALTDASQVRVVAQSSVFVHAPDGFIDRHSCADQGTCTCIKIAAKEKRPLLEYLRAFHDIHEDSVFNDLPGFLANEENFKTQTVHHYRGIAFHRQGEFDNAVECYDLAINSRPERAIPYFNRALAKSRRMDQDGAISDYSKAIQLQPDYTVAFYNRGLERHDIGDNPRAIADYSAAIRLQPDFADAYFKRGFARSANGDHSEAIDDFIEARRLRPGLFRAGAILGVDRGISDFDKYMQAQPQDAKGFYNRGQLRFDIRDFPGAISDCSKAIQLQPDHAGAYFNRAIARKEMGDHDGARDDYDKASEIDPRFGPSSKLNKAGLSNRGI